MQKLLYKNAGLWFVLTIILPFSGCAPGPPPPPVFPGLFGFGMGWLVIGILIWAGILFLKNSRPEEKPKADYLTEALNAINQRLKTLEEKMEQREEHNHKNRE